MIDDVPADATPDHRMNERAVRAVLADSQRSGFLGDRPIDEVIAHARVFVRGLGDDASPTSIVDLGAGGGVPGLVIALDRPSCRLTMVDRRAKRTDFLERVVGRLGWTDRVEVVCDDAQHVARDRARSFDAVVARGFGPPTATIRLAARLVRPGGHIVISEPPTGDRWDPALIAALDLRVQHVTDPAGRVAVFRTAEQG